jgi:hypothetical protein
LQCAFATRLIYFEVAFDYAAQQDYATPAWHTCHLVGQTVSMTCSRGAVA